MTLIRGSIHRYHPRKTSGHEQRGTRYAVVLQVPMPLSTVLIAPTSTQARPGVFRVQAEFAGEPSVVLLDQIRAVDAELLGALAGSLTYDQLAACEDGIRYLFALDE